MKYARGRVICERECRVEKARAHRKSRRSPQVDQVDENLGLFEFWSKDGDFLTPELAKTLLEDFGGITYCRLPNDVERASLNLGDSILVHFNLYEQGQVALQVRLALVDNMSRG